MRRKDGAPGAFVAGAIGPIAACRPTCRAAPRSAPANPLVPASGKPSPEPG